MSRLLVVDDDVETCRFLAELLELPGRQFVSEQDPDAALRRIGQETFDLLISDINLNAARSGLDLLRRFKAEQHAPVVLISGFGTLETAIDAMRAGAFDYISKPFVIEDVKRIIERSDTGNSRISRTADASSAVPGMRKECCAASVTRVSRRTHARAWP